MDEDTYPSEYISAIIEFLVGWQPTLKPMEGISIASLSDLTQKNEKLKKALVNLEGLKNELLDLEIKYKVMMKVRTEGGTPGEV